MGMYIRNHSQYKHRVMHTFQRKNKTRIQYFLPYYDHEKFMDIVSSRDDIDGSHMGFHVNPFNKAGEVVACLSTASTYITLEDLVVSHMSHNFSTLQYSNNHPQQISPHQTIMVREKMTSFNNHQLQNHFPNMIATLECHRFQFLGGIRIWSSQMFLPNPSSHNFGSVVVPNFHFHTYLLSTRLTYIHSSFKIMVCGRRNIGANTSSQCTHHNYEATHPITTDEKETRGDTTAYTHSISENTHTHFNSLANVPLQD